MRGAGSCGSRKEGPLNQAGGWSEDLAEVMAQAGFRAVKKTGLPEELQQIPGWRKGRWETELERWPQEGASRYIQETEISPESCRHHEGF